MTIIKYKNFDSILVGTCQQCKCQVYCDVKETKSYNEDSKPAGSNYVKCPECDNKYLWVS